VRWARSAILLSALFAVAVTGGCAKDRQKELETLKSSIEAVNARFADAFARRDVAAIGQCYTTDAEAYPPGTSPVAGRAAIQDMWKGLLGMPVGRLQLRTIEVDGNDTSAWEAGRYTLVGSNGGTLDDGKYIVVWKHETDGWRMYRYMWSSDTPQQTVPAAQPAAP
jgi:ketosteroid isomerase-like protein